VYNMIYSYLHQFIVFLRDPIWGFIGVSLNAILVFFGAYFGSKLGYKYTVKKHNEDLIQFKVSYIHYLKEELEYNRMALSNINSYLGDQPPVQEAFDPIKTGIRYLRFQAWDDLVRAGLLPLLTVEEHRTHRITDRTVRDTTRIIEMTCGNWLRLMSFHRWDITHGIKPSNIDKDVNRLASHMKERIEYCIDNIDRSLKLINNSESEGYN
jgi:hypothetical protein